MEHRYSELERGGWKLARAGTPHRVPPSIACRYPGLEETDAFRFIAGLDSCVSTDDRSWFVCVPDMLGV